MADSIIQRRFNPKTAWGGGQFEGPLPCCFLQNVSSKEKVKPLVFETFTIIVSYIFPENFIENFEVVQKI